MDKLLLLLLGLTSLALSNSLVQGTGKFNGPKYIGRFKNKEYLASNTFNVTWEESKTICSEFDMTLANVETPEEYAYLSSSYSDVFYEGYWTGARDSHLMRQFSWDKNDAPIVVDMPLVFGDVYPSLTCGIIRPFADAPAQLRLQPCDHRFVDVGTLCERIADSSKS